MSGWELLIGRDRLNTPPGVWELTLSRGRTLKGSAPGVQFRLVVVRRVFSLSVYRYAARRVREAAA